MEAQILLGSLCFAALLSLGLSFPYDDVEHCFDGKTYQAKLYKNWTSEFCYDLEGNEYKDGAILLSCCGCLKLTCMTKASTRDFYDKESHWNLTKEDSCCEDCHGSVFPAGAIMNVTKEDDNCETTRTTKCVYVEKDGVKGGAVTEVSYGFKNCCTDDNGIKSIEAFEWDPKTCSKRTCELPQGNKFASWISKTEKPGCNCCLFKNYITNDWDLVADGEPCVIEDQPDAKCCKGECLVPVA